MRKGHEGEAIAPSSFGRRDSARELALHVDTDTKNKQQCAYTGMNYADRENKNFFFFEDLWWRM
jgi:hypothetical protein